MAPGKSGYLIVIGAAACGTGVGSRGDTCNGVGVATTFQVSADPVTPGIDGRAPLLQQPDGHDLAEFGGGDSAAGRRCNPVVAGTLMVLQ